MSLGFRPKHLAGTDAPIYSPERDLAYIGPTLFKDAFENLDEANQPPELKQWLQSQGIEDSAIDPAIQAFAHAQKYYVTNEPEDKVTTPGEALAKLNFYQLPFSLRMLLFATIGETVAGAWFRFVRDVTWQDHDAPCHTSIAEMLVMGRTVAQRLSRTSVELPAGQVELEDLRTTKTNHIRRINSLESDLRLANSRQQLAERQQSSGAAAAAERECQLEATIQSHLKASLWAHLKIWWQHKQSTAA